MYIVTVGIDLNAPPHSPPENSTSYPFGRELVRTETEARDVLQKEYEALAKVGRKMILKIEAVAESTKLQRGDDPNLTLPVQAEYIKAYHKKLRLQDSANSWLDGVQKKKNKSKEIRRKRKKAKSKEKSKKSSETITPPGR